MKDFNSLNVELPSTPNQYHWETGSEVHDYYFVHYVALRKQTWWIFSKTIFWYGLRDEKAPYQRLKRAAEEMLTRL